MSLEQLQHWFAQIGPAYPVGFGIAAAVSLLLTPWVRRLAVRQGVVDHPGEARRVHTRVTPRWGGLAIAAGFFLSLSALALLDSGALKAFSADINRVRVIVIGGGAMLLLGACDDARGANAWQKLIVQIPAALLLVLSGFGFRIIELPWGGVVEIGLWGDVLAVLWVVGVTNAINLIDGLDGLAAGVCLIALGAIFVLAVANASLVMAVVCVCLAGALLGFLVYNVHPASIFMGDAGSLFVGYVVAASSVMANFKSQTTVALGLPIMLLGLPLADTIFAIFRRTLRSRSPFTADKEHIHHRLLSRGLSHRAAVWVMWGVAALCAVATILIESLGSRWVFWGALVYVLLALLGGRWLGYLQVGRWREEFQQGRRDRARRHQLHALQRKLIAQIEAAPDLAQAFAQLAQEVALHRSDAVELALLDDAGAPISPPALQGRGQPVGGVGVGLGRAIGPLLGLRRPITGEHPKAAQRFELEGPGGLRAQITYQMGPDQPPLDELERATLGRVHAVLAPKLSPALPSAS